MKRLALAFLLLLAPAAQAQPQALGRAESVTLADGAAIVAHASSKTVTVTRAPLDGGIPAVLLSVPVAANRHGSVELAASHQRVAALVTLSGRSGAIRSATLYTGPPDGPLTAVKGHGDTLDLEVAGDSVLLEGEKGWNALAPDGAITKITIPSDAVNVTFAGDLVAYGADPPTEEDPPTRLVIANWRSSAKVRDLDLPAGLMDLDLSDDGRAVIETDGGPLRELPPDGPLRDLPYDAGQPVLAGDRFVGVRRDATGVMRMIVLDPGGRQQRVGLPSQQVADFTADAGHVVWESNGCAFSAALDDPFGTTFANRGCRSAEIDLPYAKAPRLARTVPVPVRCLNAADGTCRGSVRGTEIRPAAYAVPAGGRRVVRVHVKPRSYRKLRREKYRVLHLTAPPGFPFLLRDRG